MNALPAVEEHCFDTPLGLLAARVWGQSGSGIPILAIHGWQDNAASHDRLIPLLMRGLGGQRRVVAVDLPGHGFSAHKQDATAYSLADYLTGLTALLGKLGWQHYILIGHSLGAALCACLAAVRPAEVAALVMIDSVGPLTGRPGTIVSQLRHSLRRQRHWPRQHCFQNLEAMAVRRAKAGDLSLAAARILVSRNYRKTTDGYIWRNDPKLRWLTPIYLSEAQIQDILGEVYAPTLIVRAHDGLLTNTDLVSARCRCLVKASLIDLPGHHHVHLDDPQPVAFNITEFLNKLPNVTD